MLPERSAIERRILSALDTTPSRIPVVLGGCGSGRTVLLQRVSALLGDGRSQYIDAERVASTPEGMLAAVTADSPYAFGDDPAVFRTERRTTRVAFDSLLRFFSQPGRTEHATPTFLIDEILEFRTLESFPGLRGGLRELLEVLARSPNRFVLTSRYVNRALRLLRDLPDRFDVTHVPPLSPSEAISTLRHLDVGRDESDRRDIGRIVHALTDGRPAYVSALGAALASTEGTASGDPVNALAGQFAPGAPLDWTCRFCYELRLHRARGYGALKAILSILAEDEPLTLTSISHRLGRTPGSTKDYLSWLEDVDLINVRQKRYSYADPLIRLWVRLHRRSRPPHETDLSREVQEYAVQRLPFIEHSVPARAESTPPDKPRAIERKSWNIIEID